jgi:hypothetical protein
MEADPDIDLTLSDDDMKEVQALIAQKMRLPLTCELCGKQDFELWDQMVTLINVQLDREKGSVCTNEARIHPSVVFTCNHCGNYKLANAQVLGFDFERPRKSK